MIEIIDKKDCVGCSACEQICPKRCIKLLSDEEGFLYPIVDKDSCIECHLCEKACPVLCKNEKSGNIVTFAAINRNDEVRMASSSGGVFYALANDVIQNDGVVFGVKFNNSWEAVHDYTETIDGVFEFIGSKYLQSVVGDSFSLVKKFLKEDRIVLFSGTPCQIAGLREYLNIPYDKLITVDIICHGVPSPKVFNVYLSGITRDKELVSYSFRNKDKGWRLFSSKAEFDFKKAYSAALNQDPFMKGFLNDLYLRPSCYNCPSKGGRSGSDVTLADFWGVENVMPSIDDNKGCSLLVIGTEKGNELVHKLPIELYSVDSVDALKANQSYFKSVAQPATRGRFFSELNNGIPFSRLINKYVRISFKQKIRRPLVAIIKKVIGR